MTWVAWCCLHWASRWRWDGGCWPCLLTQGNKGRVFHMMGYFLGTGTSGLYSIAHLHWDGLQISDSYTVPIFHPPLLSFVLAPGWATHAKGKIAKKIKSSQKKFKKKQTNKTIMYVVMSTLTLHRLMSHHNIKIQDYLAVNINIL